MPTESFSPLIGFAHQQQGANMGKWNPLRAKIVPALWVLLSQSGVDKCCCVKTAWRMCKSQHLIQKDSKVWLSLRRCVGPDQLAFFFLSSPPPAPPALNGCLEERTF